MVSYAKSNNNLENSAKTCDSNENSSVKRKLFLDSCLGSAKFPSRVLKLSNKKASFTEQAEMYKKNLEYRYLSYSNKVKPYKTHQIGLSIDATKNIKSWSVKKGMGWVKNKKDLILNFLLS